MLQTQKCFKNDVQVCANVADYQDTTFSQYVLGSLGFLSQSVKGYVGNDNNQQESISKNN